MRDEAAGQLLSIENIGALPAVFEVSRLEQDEILKKRADSLIGSVALDQSISIDRVNESSQEYPDTSNNLAESISLAREGDPRAVEHLTINVKTDWVERAFKSGFVMAVDIDRDEEGQLTQNGQTLRSVQVNSLKHLSNKSLRERAKVEALHTLRDQYYADNGVFKDYARVTLSLVHDQMSDSEADEAGFFTQTRSLAIQFVTEDENGGVIIESAFVAGKQSPNAAPFDMAAAHKFAMELGVDYSGLGSEEMHARPILVSKAVLPDVLSGAQLFDESAGEVTGIPKFFGKNTAVIATREDYTRRYRENKKMIADMSDDVDSVVQELINTNPQSPVQATAELARLNDKLLKSRIIADERIDASVLGVEAAYRVNHARHRRREFNNMPLEMQQQNQIIMKDIALLQQEINDKGSSSSCPGGASTKNSDLMSGELNDQESSSDSQETVEDCDFVSKECPKCGKEDVETKCRGGKYYGECGCVSD